MVAHADTTTPLPPLTPEDKHRLHRYFTLHQSLEALATDLAKLHPSQESHPSQDSPASHFATLPLSHSATSPLPDQFDLAAWLLSDSIAPHIAFHKAARENSDKQLAIEALKLVIQNAPHPTEKRRAATTLLRALSHQRPSPVGRASGPPSNHPNQTSSPPHQVTSSSPSPPPLTILEAFTQGEIKTPSDCPLPAPEFTPEDIVAIALRAIQHPDTPSTDAGPITLYNLKGYTQDRTLASLHEFKNNALKNWVHEAWSFKSAGEPTPLTFAHGVGTTFVPITLPDGLTLKFKFQLERPASGTLAHCWLLRHFMCQSRRQAHTARPTNTS